MSFGSVGVMSGANSCKGSGEGSVPRLEASIVVNRNQKNLILETIRNQGTLPISEQYEVFFVQIWPTLAASGSKPRDIEGLRDLVQSLVPDGPGVTYYQALKAVHGALGEIPDLEPRLRKAKWTASNFLSFRTGFNAFRKAHLRYPKVQSVPMATMFYWLLDHPEITPDRFYRHLESSYEILVRTLLSPSEPAEHTPTPEKQKSGHRKKKRNESRAVTTEEGGGTL